MDKKEEKKKGEEKEVKEEQSAIDQVNDLEGLDGDGVEFKSKRKGTVYIMPSAICDLPKFQKNFEDWNEISTKDAKSGGGFLSKSSVEQMAELIHLGVKEKQPNITLEQCGKLFSISDFAGILVIMLDLNDFFASMREMNIKQTALVNAQNAK